MRVCCILLSCLLLTGCGTYYSVTVDSLREQAATDEAGNRYCLLPADGIAEDDLLFREVKRLLAPAFAQQGFEYMDSCDAADAAVVVSYEAGEPQVEISTYTTTSYQPVIVRHRGERRVEHVLVEEPQIVTTTIYSAYMLLEGRQWQNGRPGKALWRTEVHSSSTADAYRSHLAAMAQVLRMTLARQLAVQQTYTVEIDDKGMMTVSE